MDGLTCPSVPVSWGELLDKITILEIKKDRIRRGDARINVLKEYRLLCDIAAALISNKVVAPLLTQLKRVNQDLWDIEDNLRSKEANGDFDSDFVRLARLVYKKNDRRAALKREINFLLNSEILEEKSYHGNDYSSPIATHHLISSPTLANSEFAGTAAR